MPWKKKKVTKIYGTQTLLGLGEFQCLTHVDIRHNIYYSIELCDFLKVSYFGFEGYNEQLW